MQKYLLLFLAAVFISGCSNPLPDEKEINGNYTLLNQDSSKVSFPQNYKDKIVVAGFIFTNCPDICPMTIHNMQRVQEKVKEEKINNVEFAAISFDPLRDKPSVLMKQAELRAVDRSNFNFFTGEQSEIDSLMKNMNITAFADDTTKTENGNPVYFFIHTDRITLIDQDGKIRKEYSGSRVDLEEITKDIKYLGD